MCLYRSKCLLYMCVHMSCVCVYILNCTHNRATRPRNVKRSMLLGLTPLRRDRRVFVKYVDLSRNLYQLDTNQSTRRSFVSSSLCLYQGVSGNQFTCLSECACLASRSSAARTSTPVSSLETPLSVTERYSPSSVRASVSFASTSCGIVVCRAKNRKSDFSSRRSAHHYFSFVFLSHHFLPMGSNQPARLPIPPAYNATNPACGHKRSTFLLLSHEIIVH